jgi:hypothetical protein
MRFKTGTCVDAEQQWQRPELLVGPQADVGAPASSVASGCAAAASARVSSVRGARKRSLAPVAGLCAE